MQCIKKSLRPLVVVTGDYRLISVLKAALRNHYNHEAPKIQFT